MVSTEGASFTLDLIDDDSNPVASVQTGEKGVYRVRWPTRFRYGLCSPAFNDFRDKVNKKLKGRIVRDSREYQNFGRIPDANDWDPEYYGFAGGIRTAEDYSTRRPVQFTLWMNGMVQAHELLTIYGILTRAASVVSDQADILPELAEFIGRTHITPFNDKVTPHIERELNRYILNKT